MNKPKKTFNGVSDPGSVLDSRKTASGTTHDSARLPELTRGTFPVWKPFEIERYQDKQNDLWFSMTSDLLHTFDELAVFFRHELQHRLWLNAYLLAAGMNQIVEDYIHTEPVLMKRSENLLDKLPQPLGPFLSKTVHSFTDIWMKMNWKRQTTRKVMDWQEKLAKLLNELAVIITNPDSADTGIANQLVADGGTLMAYIPYFPVALREMIQKLPSCFRSFDQQPEDFKRIAEKFSLHWPDRHHPITILGIRTSGSYLAPLYSAYLRSLGYWNINVYTLRPGARLTDQEKEAFDAMVSRDSLVLVCDDPPISGTAISRVVGSLEQVGIPERNIVLFLQLFGDYESLPPALQKYPSVLTSWNNWTIHQQIEVDVIEQILSEACEPSYQLSNMVRVPSLDSEDVRGHVTALYEMALFNEETNQMCARLVRVKGVGLGYFGEHALAVLQKLNAYSPQLITFQNGLLFQEVSLPAQTLAASVDTNKEVIINHLVDYIIERNHQLPAKRDTSLRLNGRTEVWEVASDMVSKAFGMGRLLARVPFVDPYIKEQLKPINPSIIDGDMSLHHWYVQDDEKKPAVKIELAERDFSHLDLSSYDPLYDLASLAMESEPFLDPSLLRYSYEVKTGHKVPDESWMLYQMVHLWDLNRQTAGPSSQTNRRMAQVVQRYFSDIYFHDVPIVSEGPLCAIDIDGVLETKHLGFPSISAAGARSLRALVLHENRVILVTGRSLEELKERCTAYHLAGGVAEYGAVIYDHATGETITLLTDEELDVLFSIRSRLSNKFGVYLDNDYRFAVRAYSLDEHGKRNHLDMQSIKEVLIETGTSDNIYAIQGEMQTDFMIKRVSKGSGIEEWVTRLGHLSNPLEGFPGDKPLALAVGDSASDLSMFTLAELAFAPANASQEVKQAGITITSRPYQRGLEQAVVKFLSHKPGSCANCRLEKQLPQTAYMLDIFSLQENGPAGILWHSLKLAMTNRGRMNGSTR